MLGEVPKVLNGQLESSNRLTEKILADDYIVVNESYAIIGNRLAYSTKEMAEQMAEDLGCTGFHVHEIEGTNWYMPCEFHELDLDEACWEGYEAIGFKYKDGKKVPNCVPKE